MSDGLDPQERKHGRVREAALLGLALKVQCPSGCEGLHGLISFLHEARVKAAEERWPEDVACARALFG
jgi:hypothetical protein